MKRLVVLSVLVLMSIVIFAQKSVTISSSQDSTLNAMIVALQEENRALRQDTQALAQIVYKQEEERDSLLITTIMAVDSAQAMKSQFVQVAKSRDSVQRIRDYDALPELSHRTWKRTKRGAEVEGSRLAFKKMKEEPVVADKIKGYPCLFINTSKLTYHITIVGPEKRTIILGPNRVLQEYLIPGNYSFRTAYKNRSATDFRHSSSYPAGNQFVVGLTPKIVAQDLVDYPGFTAIDPALIQGDRVMTYGGIYF